MWCIWEEDPQGEGIAYYYHTRAAARRHYRRIRENIFFAGWLVRGGHTETNAEVM